MCQSQLHRCELSSLLIKIGGSGVVVVWYGANLHHVK